MMFEVISFIGPAVLSALFKIVGKREEVNKRSHEREMALIGVQQKARDAAAARGSGQTRWEQVWRVPVRPVITYAAFGAFVSLPFVAAIHPVNMEVCQPQTGFFAWLFGQEDALCRYIQLGPGLTWTHTHTTVTLMITGFWFGDKVVK